MLQLTPGYLQWAPIIGARCKGATPRQLQHWVLLNSFRPEGLRAATRESRRRGGAP